MGRGASSLTIRDALRELIRAAAEGVAICLGLAALSALAVAMPIFISLALRSLK